MKEQFNDKVSEPNESRDPNLLKCQIALRELCLKVLSLRPEGSPFTFMPITTTIDSKRVDEALHNLGTSDLLLRDGESLSIPNGGEYYPDLDLYVGKAALTGAGIQAWGWNYPKVRKDETNPEGYREFPGETDWSHQLDIKLFYANKKQYASQNVSIATSILSAGTLPSISRSISAFEYAETGYEGHNFVHRNASDEDEIVELIDLANQMFNARN